MKHFSISARDVTPHDVEEAINAAFTKVFGPTWSDRPDPDDGRRNRIPDEMYVICAQNGMTKAETAQFLGVAWDTVHYAGYRLALKFRKVSDGEAD